MHQKIMDLQMSIKEALAELDVDLEAISDPSVKILMSKLLNIIELLASENKALREENQKLRDENNRLKGSSGKPSIRPQSQSNISSEEERKPKNKPPRKKTKKKKKKARAITRVEVCQLNLDELPSDYQFKGYQTSIVQDIVITTEVIQFKKAVYYSPSMKRSFMASAPAGYEGDYGPRLKALLIDLHYGHKMTESALHTFACSQGIAISIATISRLLIDGQEIFHAEKGDIIKAGLTATAYQKMDDTGARVQGKNYYTHVLCNPYYTAYFTRRHKDRLTIIELLTQGEMKFIFNEESYALMATMNLSKKALAALEKLELQVSMTRIEIDALLKRLYLWDHKRSTNRQIILEATVIIGYQQRPDAIQLLLTDDAPQFKQITKSLALCWIHDGRHYKKLMPILISHQRILDEFLENYWAYYHRLLAYKETPTPPLAKELEQAFDGLFSTKTGYAALDERIEKTMLKKNALLLVLTYPALPLHNNASELGARTQARYRDVSYDTMSRKGTEAKDTFMSILSTAKKLAINGYAYLLDRILKKNDLPSLADCILQQSQAVA